jgi:plasmid stability protein
LGIRGRPSAGPREASLTLFVEDLVIESKRTRCSDFRMGAIMIAMEVNMAQILVRKVEDQLKSRLQHRAKQHGRSMEEEAREILRNALKAEETQAVGFGTASVALFSGQGIFLDEPIQEIRGMRMQIPDFES